MEHFDPEAALLKALDERVERLKTTRETANALGCEIAQVAADIAACQQLRRTLVRNWARSRRPAARAAKA